MLAKVINLAERLSDVHAAECIAVMTALYTALLKNPGPIMEVWIHKVTTNLKSSQDGRILLCDSLKVLIMCLYHQIYM